MPGFFGGHTAGDPVHTAICLMVVIQQGCSGTSELSNMPTVGEWAVEKSVSVCVCVCGEDGVKPRPARG